MNEHVIATAIVWSPWIVFALTGGTFSENSIKWIFLSEAIATCGIWIGLAIK